MSAADFFNKDELEALPPIERAKLIKKRREELEKTLKEEAEVLEKESLDELVKQKEDLDKIVEQELEEKQKHEKEEKQRIQSMLEKTIKESPEANKKQEVVEYGPKVPNTKYESTISGNNSANTNYEVGSSQVSFRSDELGHKLYSKPKKDYL